ncbi:MAG: tRNA N6-adenosine threonylcarbamoyltransferase [Syntrophorhabdus sp. PtaU1.Bin058]|nr:MAG: tRNA N6-adenosine threonylcarbamoyltransferase [Syntrophorhabdus sp. PtaU1.Bin058]
MLILGIDTSCDDTSVALLRNGKEILSNIVSSQVDLHAVFGGVVPEIASRKHLEFIDIILKEALREGNADPRDLDAISVTAGPGLIGSVLIGLCFAKGLAFSLQKPLIGVNHIEAHAMSIFLERDVDFPFIALVVSGGHTIILRIDEPCTYSVLGTTRDDAAGEAFDKIAKYLAIGYPGGRIIEEYSRKGRKDYVAFPRPMMDDNTCDFSFSGLKTAFVNYVKNNGISEGNMPDILASFQEAVIDVLFLKTFRAIKKTGITRVVVGGGVASNGRLREVFLERGRGEGLDVMFSSPEFCTDNGAMVAMLGYYYLQKGIVSPPDVKGFSRMSLR